MSCDTTTASSLAGGDDAGRALRLMARKSSAAGVRVSAVHGAIELRGIDPDNRPLVALITPATWLLWRQKTWVVAVPQKDDAGGDKLWQLTAKGRQHLRRQLSACENAALPKVSRHVQPGRAAASRPTVNPNESPIGWLARRRDKNGAPMISSEQLTAAERLRSDFWFAGMSPRVTTNWSAASLGGSSNRSGGNTDVSDNMIAAATRVRHAVAAVGPELGSILIDVCCLLNGLETAERKAGWPLRSGKVVLQLALTRLARHYGLLAPVTNGSSERARVRHWGSDGYRPVIGSSDE
jgi:Domain of unknown function (DUF6456)